MIIGAGIGGLTSALELAARGVEVLVLEASASPGGKMRQIVLNGRAIDAGPTVLTMRWVFEGLFEDVGESFADHVTLQPADVLARHAWHDGARGHCGQAGLRSTTTTGMFGSRARS